MVTDLKELKEEYSELSDQARMLSKQAREATSRVKKLRAELRENKKKRDEENAKVKEFKEKRDMVNLRIREKIREVNLIQDGIKDLKKNLGVPFNQARKQLERLEWKLQTEVFSVKEEEKIVRHIEELEEMTKSSKEFVEKRKRLEKIRRELDDLRKEAQAFHEIMIEHARQSEFYHQKMVEIYDKLKALEPDFKEVTEKITKAREQAFKARKKYVEKYKEVKGKTETEIREEMEKEAAKLLEGFRKGKKLTTKELQIIQQYGDSL
ncbi:MAG: hypothetical protein J7L23_01460 [Candidatus Diapherotrites archaeon]|nr:hypothetical protein [Candidatus Diapherotrites archaeon]